MCGRGVGQGKSARPAPSMLYLLTKTSGETFRVGIFLKRFRQLTTTYDAPPWGVRADERAGEIELASVVVEVNGSIDAVPEPGSGKR